MSEEIIQATKPRIQQLAERDRAVAISCIWNDMLTLEEFTATFGAKALFEGAALRAIQGGLASMAATLMHNVLTGWIHSSGEKPVRQLAQIGQILLNAEVPWTSLKALREDAFFSWGGEYKAGSPKLELSSDSLFGAWALAAVLSEASTSRDQLIEQISRTKDGFVSDIGRLIAARFHRAEPKPSSQILEQFNSEQRRLLRDWIDHKIDLLENSRQTAGPTGSASSVQRATGK